MPEDAESRGPDHKQNPERAGGHPGNLSGVPVEPLPGARADLIGENTAARALVRSPPA
jgi:hypothetical protein